MNTPETPDIESDMARRVKRGMVAGLIGGLIVGSAAVVAANFLGVLHTNALDFVIDGGVPPIIGTSVSGYHGYRVESIAHRVAGQINQ